MSSNAKSTAWKDAWTGGQYSLVRVLAGSTITVALVREVWGAGQFQSFPAGLAVGAAAVTLGVGGRPLALAMALLISFADASTLSWGTFQLAMLWLGLHVALPAAPYGSLAARARENPDGGWRMPGWFPACWQTLFVVTRLGASVAWLTDGHDVLAAMFAAIGVLAMARPSALLAWALSFGLESVLAAAGHEPWGAVLLLHLLAFQPVWIPRRDRATPALVFYDGTCALCHGCVRFLMAEDREPPIFHVAPLDGPTFEERVPERIRVGRPDSILVEHGGEVLMRSSAVIAILEPLGGLWWVAAGVLRLLPRALADVGYEFVANRRYQWFGRKTDACPLLPPEMRKRFEA